MFNKYIYRWTWRWPIQRSIFYIIRKKLKKENLLLPQTIKTCLKSVSFQTNKETGSLEVFSKIVIPRPITLEIFSDAKAHEIKIDVKKGIEAKNYDEQVRCTQWKGPLEKSLKGFLRPSNIYILGKDGETEAIGSWIEKTWRSFRFHCQR